MCLIGNTSLNFGLRLLCAFEIINSNDRIIDYQGLYNVFSVGDTKDGNVENLRYLSKILKRSIEIYDCNESRFIEYLEECNAKINSKLRLVCQNENYFSVLENSKIYSI